jgi:hypothetical protein
VSAWRPFSTGTSVRVEYPVMKIDIPVGESELIVSRLFSSSVSLSGSSRRHVAGSHNCLLHG